MQRLFSSKQTERHQQNLQNTHGHARQCTTAHLSFVTVIFSSSLYNASASKTNAFLFRTNYGNLNFRFFAASQISEAEECIGLTKKRGNITLYQALLHVNTGKYMIFWNLSYPYGIADIRMQYLIDLDECGIELQAASHSIGKAYVEY